MRNSTARRRQSWMVWTWHLPVRGKVEKRKHMERASSRSRSASTKVGYLCPGRGRGGKSHPAPVPAKSCRGWWRPCARKDRAPWSTHLLHIPPKPETHRDRVSLPGTQEPTFMGTSKWFHGEPGSSLGEGLVTPPITGWGKLILGHPQGLSVGEFQPGHPKTKHACSLRCGRWHPLARWKPQDPNAVIGGDGAAAGCPNHLPSQVQSLLGQWPSLGAISLSPLCTSTARSQTMRRPAEPVPSLLGPLLSHCHQIHQLCWHDSPSTSPPPRKTWLREGRRALGTFWSHVTARHSLLAHALLQPVFSMLRPSPPAQKHPLPSIPPEPL